SARPFDCPVPPSGTGNVSEVLQSGTPAPELGVSHTVGRVPRCRGGSGSGGPYVREGQGVAAGEGRGCAPSRCARLRCAAALTRRGRLAFSQSLKEKMFFGLDNGVHLRTLDLF